jgi:signal peptidase I
VSSAAAGPERPRQPAHPEAFNVPKRNVEHLRPGSVEYPMNAGTLRNRARHWWREEIRPVVILALVVCSLRSSLADWNDVPTGSMKPTILEGDRVCVNKLAYDLKVPFTTWHLAEWSNPSRGEIVVFFSPHDGRRLVKRVVGLPGDLIELRNGSLVLDGQVVPYRPIAEELLRDVDASERVSHLYVSEQLPGQSHPVAAHPGVPARRDYGPYRVPEGWYFMLGDNRDESFDSRYFGPVERKQIVGRATVVALSLDRQRYWAPRWHRFFYSLDH